MSYINANMILPKELVNEIQKYVQGVNLYIPRISEKKKTEITIWIALTNMSFMRGTGKFISYSNQAVKFRN